MYRLKLPKGLRIHPTFHASLLEPAPRNASLATEEIEQEGEEEFEVEEVLDSRESQQGVEFLVKWDGYPPEENS